MPRYKFTGLVGEGVAILRAKAVRKKGEATGPFESAGFSLELFADDLRSMGEKCLLLADQADEYKARAERIKVAPVAVPSGEP